MRDGHIGHTPFTGSFNHKGKRKVFPPVGLIDVHVYGQAELSSKVKNGSDMVLRAIIQRGCAADGIRDEMEERGPMRLTEVLESQKAVIQIARNLAKEGTIMMGGGEDDYV